MSNRDGKIRKVNFKVGQKCPQCEKGKLEPCECSSCHKRKKYNLVCKTCNWTSF